MNKFFLFFLLSTAFSLGESPFKKKQSEIYGLLVVETATGNIIGKATEMNATIVPSQGPFEVIFNQETGDSMSSATKEVKKFISVRHDENFSDYTVELAFANKYTPKDGPSAAVACALMVDSLITGKAIDSGFAVTGDMTAAGKINPVGGVEGKVRAAVGAECTMMGVPFENEEAISDLLLIDGIEPLYKISIYSLKEFEDAEAIAYIDNHSAELKKAQEEFKLVQDALARDERFIYNPKMIGKLQAIYKMDPKNLSAKYLILHGTKNAPKTISLAGSIGLIEKERAALGQILNSDNWVEKGFGEEDALLKYVLNHSRLNKIIDPRTQKYYLSFYHLSNFLNRARKRKTWNKSIISELNQHLEKVDGARANLLNNKEVQKELLGE